MDRIQSLRLAPGGASLLLTQPVSTPELSPIGVAVVADRDTSRSALLTLLESESDLRVAGSAATFEEIDGVLALPGLRVVLVNLGLGAPGTDSVGVSIIRHIKGVRPDLGVLSLKRDVDEPNLRAALDAGADACCMASIPGARLVQAIKAVATGATWLDPEISTILLHPARRSDVGAPHLSPRERQILHLLVDGYTNEEIADRLVCAPATVKTHLLHLFRKLGVRDRVSAAVSALRNGLLT